MSDEISPGHALGGPEHLLLPATFAVAAAAGVSLLGVMQVNQAVFTQHVRDAYGPSFLEDVSEDTLVENFGVDKKYFTVLVGTEVLGEREHFDAQRSDGDILDRVVAHLRNKNVPAVSALLAGATVRSAPAAVQDAAMDNLLRGLARMAFATGKASIDEAVRTPPPATGKRFHAYQGALDQVNAALADLGVEVALPRVFPGQRGGLFGAIETQQKRAAQRGVGRN